MSAGSVAGLVASTVIAANLLGRYQPFADLIQQSQSGPYSNLSIVVENGVISQSLGGGQKLTIKAQRVELSRDHRQITATDIHDSYISRANGLKIVSFSAGSATVAANYGITEPVFQGSVRIDNGVHAASQLFPQPHIACSSLVWDSRSEYVICPGTLTASLPGYETTLTGQNLQYDVKTGDVNVSHVHGIFHLPEAVQ